MYEIAYEWSCILTADSAWDAGRPSLVTVYVYTNGIILLGQSSGEIMR